MTQVYVCVRLGNDDVVPGEKVSTVEAIVRMQGAIEELRRRAAPVFDASWGERCAPLLGPSADELRNFINR